METLANLESFVRAAEEGTFSGAGRRLGLTPAAVSRNVAILERNLDVRLFQRSTRNLQLTEAGQQFLASIGGTLDALKSAISEATLGGSEPAGLLRASLSPTFGMMHVLPLLPRFQASHPLIRLEWRFENRPVDLIAENLDLAIGGGFDVSPGLVARPVCPAHIVAVASPGYMDEREWPRRPSELVRHTGIVMRSQRTGRVPHWTMADDKGNAEHAAIPESIVFNDPAAMRDAACMGLGVSLLAMPDVWPALHRGELVRLLPGWHADAGSVSLYYPTRAHMPAKTRTFIDFLLGAFEQADIKGRFDAGASR